MVRDNRDKWKLGQTSKVLVETTELVHPTDQILLSWSEIG